MTGIRVEHPVPLATGVSREYLLHHRVCPRAFDDHGSLVVAVAPDALPLSANVE